MKRILTNLFIVSMAVFTSLAFSQSTSKELDDPVIQHIELTLDLANSSNKIVSALSVDGQVSSDSIPTMTVDIYQSGRRIMTWSGQLPVDFNDPSKPQKIEFMYEANVEEQIFTLTELTAELKQKIAVKNPDLVASSGTRSKGGRNQRFYNSLQPDKSLLDPSATGYLYPSTFVRITAIDPILIILSRTYLQVNGISDRSSIVWCNANYYHLWKLAGNYEWPLDTTWFRDSGSINWPTPNSWTSTGYTTTTEAKYGNWDWGLDNVKTSVEHTISFTVMPSGLASFNYTHEDSGESSLLIRGLFDAASVF